MKGGTVKARRVFNGAPKGKRKSSSAHLSLVADAFHAFTSASRDLQSSYGALQERVRVLTVELAEANRRLSTSREEGERMRQYLENVLAEIGKGVVVVDGEERISVFNRAAEALTGYTREEVQGQPVRSVFHLSSDVDLQPSGSPSVAKLLTPNGEWRKVEWSASPILDSDGAFRGAVILLEDLAEKRRADEVRERIKTFSALGEMSVTIAHEIRNPLGAMELFASLLMEEFRSDPRKGELVENLMHGVHTLNAIVSNLLFFARPIHPLLDSLDLHEAVDDALGFAVHAVRQKRIALAKAYCRGPLTVCGDREQLKQVFLNLLLNAVQAMDDGGRLVIQTRRRSSAKGGQPGTRAGGVGAGREINAGREIVEVSIADSGSGIPPDVLSRIFDPFFTTKPKGTGLGLAIVQRILDQHGAAVRVRSSRERGTTFILSFPHNDVRNDAAGYPDPASRTQLRWVPPPVDRAAARRISR
jgi:PAS domain S-box-containing protein